jgi:exodeoxyribonuclease VII large subunit
VRALTPSEAAERVVPAADEMRDYLTRQQSRLAAALRGRFNAAQTRVEHLASRRVFRRPLERVQLLARRVDELQARGARAIDRRLEQAKSQIQQKAAQLESLSPLGVLARGYSLTTRVTDGEIVREAEQLAVGDELRTRLASGEVTSRVEQVAAPRKIKRKVTDL